MPNDISAETTIVQETPLSKLKHDQQTVIYTRNILYSIKNYVNDPSEHNRAWLVTYIQMAAQHAIESGGSGSEAFSRLIGLGILADMPKIQMVEENKGQSLKRSDDLVEIRKQADGSTKIKCSIYLNANWPEESGEETWNKRSFEGELSKAELEVIYPAGGYDKTLDELNTKYDSLLNQIDDIDD